MPNINHRLYSKLQELEKTLKEKTGISEENLLNDFMKDLPENLRCPITEGIMLNPFATTIDDKVYICSEDVLFNGSVIMDKFSGIPLFTHPMTGTAFRPDQAQSDLATFKAVTSYLKTKIKEFEGLIQQVDDMVQEMEQSQNSRPKLGL